MEVKATVRTTATQWDVCYTIYGPAAAVQAEIDYLLAKFDPRGYGTYVESNVADGAMYTAIVKRARTAD